MSLVFDTSLYMNGGAGGSVDQTYDPTSPKAQSGTAVAQAIAGITIPTVNNATLTITQGGVSKGTFTANAGTDVTIALDSGVDIDNTTITENASNQLQASAVKNARTGTDTLHIWQGTEQQWTNGVGTDWYNWKTDTVASTETVFQTVNSTYQFFNSNNNLLLGVENNSVNSSNKLCYSSNGIDWNESTLPETTMWASPVHGNGMTLVFKWFWSNRVDTTKYVYSTDFTNWQVGTLPIGATYSDVSMRKSFYTGSLFLVDTNTINYAYSSDGVNWTAATLPFASHSLWYVNGKFICLEVNGTRQAYSNDGVTWTTSQVALPISASWTGLVYGNGMYVALGSNNSYMYSLDGENWTTVSITSSISYSRLEYIDGFGFICLQYSTTEAAGKYYLRSIDGSSVVEQEDNGLPWGFWGAIVFKNNLYGSYSTSINKITFDQSQCYTLEATPTTASTVYSAPNTSSALTVTSTGTGTITLSDNNTYTYTSSGDVTTYQTIGDVYPNWLCNINGVGVKVGNTLVANATDTSGLQQLLTAGTGIDITNNTISVTSPTLINKSTGNNSLNIDGFSYYNYDRSVNIGKDSYTTSYNSVALGAYANAGQYGTALGYGTAASGTSAIAIGTQAGTSSTSSNVMQFGKGTNNESNTVKFGNGTNNWTLLDLTTGLIPDARLSSNVQTTSNLVTSVSSSSTDTQYPSAKLFYDTVGNIEATLDAIIAQGSNS